MIKLIIGGGPNDTKVMLDDVDITAQLNVHSIDISTIEPNALVSCSLNVYAQAEIELLPEGITVNVADVESPAYDLSDMLMCEGGVDTIVDDLSCATGRSCDYGPHGPNGSIQCAYCGASKPYSGPVRKP